MSPYRTAPEIAEAPTLCPICDRPVRHTWAFPGGPLIKAQCSSCNFVLVPSVPMVSLTKEPKD